MLRGKIAVITGGGGGFGQALCVWLAREGVEVDFCARRADDIQKTCSIIIAEIGIAKGYICDLARPESLSQFSSQLLTSDMPIDILILNAAQWLSGTLDDQPDTEIINTVSSGLTGPILLTQALLPGLRRSDSADAVSIISSCGPSGSEAEKCDIHNNSLLSLILVIFRLRHLIVRKWCTNGMVRQKVILLSFGGDYRRGH